MPPNEVTNIFRVNLNKIFSINILFNYKVLFYLYNIDNKSK